MLNLPGRPADCCPVRTHDSVRCFACRSTTPVAEAVTTASRELLVCRHCFTVLVDEERTVPPAQRRPVDATTPVPAGSSDGLDT